MEEYLTETLNLLQDEILNGLTKEILGKYMPEKKLSLFKKKEVFLELAKKACEKDKTLLKTIYEENQELFALSPYQLELNLEITKTERKKWGEDGRLRIISYADVNKYGRTLEVPLYDMVQCAYLRKNTELIEAWRMADAEKAEQNRKKGAIKAQETKRKRNVIRSEKRKEIEDMIEGWEMIDHDLCQVMKLAYWSLWISRLAKKYQLKTVHAITKEKEYAAIKESYYSLKNQAVELLAKTSFAKAAFYRPEFCNKYSNIRFCKKHFYQYQMERYEEDVRRFEFIHLHREELLQCKECHFEEKKDYYSLYYLEIADARIPEYTFSFHTPYEIGFAIWGDSAQLEQVKHEENDGMFRFGRALLEDEEIIYTDKYVVESFEKAMEKVKAIYENQTEEVRENSVIAI